MRTPEAGKELEKLGEGLSVKTLEVTDAASVDAFAKEVKKISSHVDVRCFPPPALRVILLERSSGQTRSRFPKL